MSDERRGDSDRLVVYLKKRWLRVKMDDDEADARRNPTITERESVLTGRTVEEEEGP